LRLVARCCFLGFVGFVRPVICGAMFVSCVCSEQAGTRVSRIGKKEKVGRTFTCLSPLSTTFWTHAPPGRAFPVPSPARICQSDSRQLHLVHTTIHHVRVRQEARAERALGRIHPSCHRQRVQRIRQGLLPFLYSSNLMNLTDHSHLRTPKSTASSKPSVSTPMPC
jgi:hypothetical protein